MQKHASVQQSLDLIEEMLNPVRARAYKEASDKLNEDGGRAADTSSSFQESSSNTIESHEKRDAVNSQTNLGREQSQDARDGGMTVEDDEDNSNEKADWFADNQGPNTLGTDDPVQSGGNIGPMAKQEISQEQKVARANNLGNAILDVIAESINKEAAYEEPYYEQPQQAYQNQPIEKQAADEFLEKLAYTSALAAQEYYEGHLMGLMKRAEDEFDIMRSNIPDEVLQKVGGVEGLLDKVAQEFPEAVMPEEVLAGGGEGLEGAGLEDAGMGVEGDELEALVGQLEAAGVTPEELEQAFADVEALQEAGVAPEELAQALTEVNDEGGGEELAAMSEEPLDIEGEAMKEASYNAYRDRIEGLKYLLRGGE